MLAKQLRKGELVGGTRVLSIVPAMLNGQRMISVRYADGTRGMYRPDREVPGSRPRTDLMAGPVHLLPGRRTGGIGGARSAGRVGRIDGESAGDRHARQLGALVYAHR